jgi:hypothetical protein
MTEMIMLKEPKMNPQEVLKANLSFKGEFVRYYKIGRGLWLRTSRFLYKIHQTATGFRLQQMRAYAN